MLTSVTGILIIKLKRKRFLLEYTKLFYSWFFLMSSSDFIIINNLTILLVGTIKNMVKSVLINFRDKPTC